MRSTRVQQPLLKITTQRRDKRGMVYELQSASGSPLEVHVWREAFDGTPHGWRVEAHDSHLADATVIGKSGVTAADALRDVGLEWNTRQLKLSEFDWDAVASLLRTVRAI
jgi:hypothetical protein